MAPPTLVINLYLALFRSGSSVQAYCKLPIYRSMSVYSKIKISDNKSVCAIWINILCVCCTRLHAIISHWQPIWSCPLSHELMAHDDVIKWKHFPRYWPFVRGIHRSPVNSPHKGQWRGALVFSLIFAWTNRWVNHRDAGDLRRHQAHYDVSVRVRNCLSEVFKNWIIFLCSTISLYPWSWPKFAPSSSPKHIYINWKWIYEIKMI